MLNLEDSAQKVAAVILARAASSHSVDAPELDQIASGLQHYPLQHGLQLPYSYAPESIYKGAPALARSDEHLPEVHEKFHYQKLKQQRWKVATLVLLLLLALAIGLSVGLSITRNRMGESVPSAPNATSESNGTQGTGHLRLKNGLLNDTSVASISLADGSRHVYFQDINGTLRHGALSPATDTWIFDHDFQLTASSPRNHTPLAVMSSATLLSSEITVYLFYIDSENLITAIAVQPNGRSNGQNVMNGSFLTAPTSRNLAVSSIMRDNSTVDLGNTTIDAEVVLLYEDITGAVAALDGKLISQLHPDGIASEPAWNWQNVTASFSPQALAYNISEAPGPDIGTPFAMGSLTRRPAPDFAIASFFNLRTLTNLSEGVFQGVQIFNFSTSGKPREYLKVGIPNATVDTISALRQSDWLMCYYCPANEPDECADLKTFFVLNETLQAVSMDSYPKTPYPFSRLAFANSTAASSMYIYHQYNESMLLEDTFAESSDWTSANISIPISYEG